MAEDKKYTPREWDLTEDFCKGCFDYVPSRAFTRYFSDPQHRRMFCTHCRKFEATIGQCYFFIQKLEAVRTACNKLKTSIEEQGKSAAGSQIIVWNIAEAILKILEAEG